MSRWQAMTFPPWEVEEARQKEQKAEAEVKARMMAAKLESMAGTHCIQVVRDG